MHTTKEEWFDLIREEYLHNFISNGGAAVKFCVSIDDAGLDGMLPLLRKTSEDEGYVLALVDAASTKIHMVDKLFHEVARQIDWDGLSRAFVKEFFTQNGYQLSEHDEYFNLQNIAKINNRTEIFFRRELRSWLEEVIFRDFEMSQEFRIAMIRLCLDQLDTTGPSVFLSNAVKEWLQGELRLIATLKNALIFQKIARHNARHMLFSLAHWLRVNGKSGLVLVLDITRYLVSIRSKNANGAFFYSLPAVLDVYEMLRQFIDGTDEMGGLLIVVLAPKEFLNDDKRGLRSYDALKLRIWDEVRDRQRQNPLASLVRLANSSAE
ncbi:MAG: hypothetical protein FD169_1978 [Bacillota bacterium]|nr:MAG: hypothetical protein FD169_1978 [Bacillota bacterium]MBS3949994.1 DUF2791 family P-loop domain-containing protein [Peptococcaceae bacterium]